MNKNYHTIKKGIKNPIQNLVLPEELAAISSIEIKIFDNLNRLVKEIVSLRKLDNSFDVDFGMDNAKNGVYEAELFLLVGLDKINKVKFKISVI